MAAPTSITVEVDRTEYSRFEPDLDTILITLAVTGTSLSGEVIQIELRKARRERDEVVFYKKVTLSDSVSQLLQISCDLTEVVDSKGISTVRRGKYFVSAFSDTDTDITDETEDFRISMISVNRLKNDYLHGTDQFASDQLDVVEQPQAITGVTVEAVSLGHPKAGFPLSYNYVVDQAPQVLGTTTEPFVLSDGQTLVLRTNDVSYTATFNTADFGDIGAATAAEVAAVVNTDIFGVVAVDDGAGKLQVDGDLVEGTRSILVDPDGSATSALGLTGQSDTEAVTRSLSWCAGPSQIIEMGRKIYTLQLGTRKGTGASDYIKVRVSSIVQLPQQSHAEDLIIDRSPLDPVRIQKIIDQAVSWVEDVELAVYLEPTNLVTTIDDEITFSDDSSLPEFGGATWDCVVDALLYTRPTGGHWIGFQMPYYPVLCFNELYGQVSNARIVDVALEWIEAHEKTGWVELVPYNQESVFNFIGLIWVEALRGPVPIPNFWNFDAIVGFRKTPEIILELVAKKAAMDILSIAGQAFRGGFSSQSISRDGVSESVSYTASATFGIYSATIEDYRKWIDKTLPKLKGSFRGPGMIVM